MTRDKAYEAIMREVTELAAKLRNYAELEEFIDHDAGSREWVRSTMERHARLCHIADRIAARWYN
jgi:hypothetical protein